MEMKQEKAIKRLKTLKARCERLVVSSDRGPEEWRKDAEAVDFALSALRPVSREKVEKVWRGEWTPGDSICPICEKNKFDGLDADIWADWMPSFCPNCGAPMTDEAVEIVMERVEALKDADD